MEPDLESLWEKIRYKKNVIGFSKSIKTRIKNGSAIEGTQVIRVYVSQKQPMSALPEADIIPPKINGIETDVVEIGKIKALSTD